MLKRKPAWLTAIAPLVVGLGSAAPAHAADPPSPNDLFPNGGFEQFGPNGVVVWKQGLSGGGFTFEQDAEGNTAVKVTGRAVFEWTPTAAPIWGSGYVLRFRARGENLKPSGFNVWTRLPNRHTPPNGNQVGPRLTGTFGWKTVEMPLDVPAGVTRLMIFVDGVTQGTLWLDDLSIVPADDRPLPLPLGTAAVGDPGEEVMAWIADEPGFPWSSHHMARDVFTEVPPKTLRFRRTIELPAGARDVRVTFNGDDHARLLVDGEEVAENRAAQEIRSVVLDGLKVSGVSGGGGHTFEFVLDNRFGPMGLLGRVQWVDAAGVAHKVPTNENWDVSADGGDTWRPAAVAALPVPAPALTHWAYPHLPKRSLTLTHPLPSGVTALRLAARGSNAVRVRVDGVEQFAQTSGGKLIKADVSAAAGGAREVELVFEDIARPPVAQGVLEITTASGTEVLSFDELRRADGGTLAEVPARFPDRTWPVNIGSFEAAATLPEPDHTGRLEPWAAELLDGARPVFAVGTDDDSSEEFAALRPAGRPLNVAGPAAAVPRGLEMQTAPEITLSFDLDAVPDRHLALVLDVADTDAVVSTVGVFVNGVMVGSPTTLGYDLVPGGRMTQRTAVVTFGSERLRAGGNTLTLRLMPLFYEDEAVKPNQAEQYINQLRLGDRADNPYPTANWLHWDHLRLVELAATPGSPVNGRPIWLGTNRDWWYLTGLEPWRSFVPRDYAWLGLSDTNAAVRYGIWEPGQYKRLDKTDPSLPDGENFTGYHLRSLVELGARPLLLYEPGRTMDRPDDFADAHETRVLRETETYIDAMEIGNEVDHPKYGWDAMTMALAWAQTMEQSAVAQRLKREIDPDLEIVAQGWYHAWDFSVIDAHSRKETDDDPGYVDALAGHSYGKSYIIPAVQYYLLYGTTPPKPIWITECGSWTEDDVRIQDFEMNLRGNLAFATHVVQFQSHADNPKMQRFGMIKGASDRAEVLEKARCYRRLQLAYGMHGTPLPWRHADPAAMAGRPVLVRAVDTGRGYRVGLVNETRQTQPVAFTVTLPQRGVFDATRFGDTPRFVEDGITRVRLEATPELSFNERLGPGEAVEYYLPYAE
ncbi:MAG: hypothetical protein AAF710_07215 [Planctomycetota bacterium]